jgi:predicted signal transduction protein with EAL and GGDEF domain
MHPHFQPIVDLHDGRAFGREALMRGKLGAVELRGAGLLAAAEAMTRSSRSTTAPARRRSRSAAAAAGRRGAVRQPRPARVAGRRELAAHDLAGRRLGADPSRICLEFVKLERCPTASCCTRWPGRRAR